MPTTPASKRPQHIVATMEQPHAAPRMTAWEGGHTRSSIFDAAGGGGTRGIDVSDFPALSSMVVSPPKGDGPPTTGKAVQPHASNALAGNKPAPTVRAVLRQRLDAATDATPLPPAVVSGAVWREEAMRTEEVFEAELRTEVLEAEWLEHVEPHPPNSGQSQQQTPSSGMSDAGCIGDAAYGVDPEFLSKVSHSRQSSKPPFLWNPYLWYLGHSQGVSPRREYTRRIHALGLTTRRVLQAVVWMSVLPSMIMQSTRNMIEAWPMLAEVAERGGGVRVLRWREASTGAPSRMTRHRMRGSRHGHRSYRHRCTEVDRYKGIHKISEDRGGEGEGERGWDSGGMLACVVMAYGLVGAALADAPTPLHYNRHGHRRHRYRDMHRRRYSFDMYDARTGNEPKHRWHSSNITYLTQRLSWRVQGSGGGV